jgi:hypothetical protein
MPCVVGIGSGDSRSARVNAYSIVFLMLEEIVVNMRGKLDVMGTEVILSRLNRYQRVSRSSNPRVRMMDAGMFIIVHSEVYIR